MKRMKLFWLLISILLLAGCASQPPIQGPKYQITNFEERGAPRPLLPSDPIEPVNRELYRFNYYLDRFVLLPAVNVYQFVVPNYVQQRVSNFLDNIGLLKNATNEVLQLKPKPLGITLSRFVINTTVGVGGLWDPAAEWGLERQDEDMGQTLGYWGVGAGPYLVLPLFGPSNARDTTGMVGDSLVFSAIDPLNFDHNDLELPYYTVSAVDLRSRQPFRYYRSGSPFEYEFVRLLYTEKRKLQVAK